MKKIFSVIVILSMIFSLSTPGFAANGTWLNTGVTSADWFRANNWVAGTIPGLTAGTTNTDVATFNTAIGANNYGTTGTPIIIDSGRNIGGITFDTAAGNYFIGSTGLNSLLLTSTGAIQILGTLNTNSNVIETVNAPLVLEAVGGSYNFTNNSANGAGVGAGTLNMGGGITGVSTGGNTTTLTLNGSNTNNNTVSGIIGNGSAGGKVGLTKSGAGTWVLSGANTYTGATAVSAGTLKAGAATQAFGIGSAVTVGTGAATATLDLNGLNETIGSLAGATDGIVTNSSGETTAILSAGSSNASTAFAGVIQDGSGVTSLTKQGTGTLTLTGTNTNTGTTTISAGTLQIGSGATTGSLGTGNVVNNSAALYGLVFDRSDSVTLANAISGTGTLEQIGTGTLIINTANTYSGTTTIFAGTLQVGDSHALGTGALINGVAGDPTLSLGTTDLILGGPYTQIAGSVLDLTANSSSTYGKITSIGNAATIANNSIVNVTVGGYIPNNSILTIVDTGGTGVGGTGAPTTVNALVSSRVNFTSSISGNNLILTADHSTTGFGSLGSNPNAQAAGNILDNETNPSSDLTNILNTLEFLSDAQVTAALNTLGPLVDGGIRDNNYASLDNFVSAAVERARYVLTAAASGNSDTTGVSAGDNAELNGLWAKGYGSYLDQGTRNGIRGYNAWNSGTAIGIDRLLDDNLTLGVSGGYAYGEVNSNANNGNTIIQSAQSTLYAGYQGTNVPYFLDGAGSFAYNWYDGGRNIVVGSINRKAKASYEGQQYGAYLDGGYKFNLGNNLQLAPVVSIEWDHLALGSYTETNAGSLDLSVNRQSYDMLESGLGASVSTKVKYGWGNLTPEVHAKWLYDFISDGMAVTSSFTGGGASFTSNGAKPAKNGANVGGTLSFDLKNDISLIAGVDTEMRDGFFGVYGSATVRYKF